MLSYLPSLAAGNSLLVLLPLLLCLPLLLTEARVSASEPADEFLSQLRARGYHDTALEYLNWAESSSLIGDEWRKLIPYHRSIALIEQSSKLNSAQASAPTTQAEQLLAEFVVANDDRPESKIASFWLGRILADKARRELKTVTDDMTGAAKRKIRNPAADKFRQAQEEFAKSGAYFEEQLKAMRKQAPSQINKPKQDEYRAFYLEGELNRAMIEYELAETVATNKEKYRKQLETAKTILGEFAMQQSKRMAGVQAKIYHARCYEDLDQVEDALAIYKEIMNEPALPELFLAQAALRSMACSVEKKNNPKEAVDTGLAWLKMHKPEPESPTAQSVRLEVGRQVLAALPSLSEGEQRKLKSEAKSVLTEAARAGGAGKSEAMQLLATLGIESSVVSTNSGGGRATAFTAAVGRSEELRSEMQPLLEAEQLLEENLERSSDPANRAEIELQLSATRQELGGKRDAAIAAYRAAISQADEADDVNSIGEAMYVCGYLYYTADAFHEAAVMGQHAAEIAPNMTSAKAAANIALASFVKLYQNAGDDNSAEAGFLVRVARFIANTWPNSKEAQDSLTMLIGFMVNDGNIAQAESFLKQIPSSSPRRAEAELRTGQAIWRSYLQAMQSANGESTNNESTNGASPQNLEKLKERAQALLLEGINRARGSNVTATTAQGTLALAQIYVDVNSPDEAVKLLNDEELGPLTLIENDSPLTESSGFLEQTYKTALRAQIGSLAKPGVDAKEAVGEAMATMDALSQAVGDSPEGKRRLTATYISLAKDLQRQLQLSNAETRADIAQAFETFLNQVADGSTEPSVLNWVAETYFSLAEGESDLSASSAKAKEYYSRSADVFKSILEQQSAGALPLDDAMLLQVQVRSAKANLAAARYKQAFDLYETVLAKKNAMLNIQVEAALALQEGAERGNADMFNQAVKGARPRDDKNVIWGWEKISKITAAQMRKSPELRAKFGKVFFDARYNIARCRYRQGLSAQGEQQSKLLGSAKRAITMTGKLYPDLGGEAWRRKFDRLMKEVQESLNEQPTGLPAS